MSRKSRKSLEDSLASQFVYGGKPEPSVKEHQPVREEIPSTPEPELPSPVELLSSNEQGTGFNLMANLHSPPKEPTVRLTVDLPESMHKKLSILAAKTGKKKVEIVRVLLAEALKEVNE